MSFIYFELSDISECPQQVLMFQEFGRGCRAMITSAFIDVFQGPSLLAFVSILPLSLANGRLFLVGCCDC